MQQTHSLHQLVIEKTDKWQYPKHIPLQLNSKKIIILIKYKLNAEVNCRRAFTCCTIWGFLRLRKWLQDNAYKKTMKNHKRLKSGHNRFKKVVFIILYLLRFFYIFCWFKTQLNAFFAESIPLELAGGWFWIGYSLAIQLGISQRQL